MNEDLRDHYIAQFGHEPTDSDELDGIERELGVQLPPDFKEIATFYSGGMVGGISHNAIAASGPATNITGETRWLRQAIGLPCNFIVLAEPPASLIVMDTTGPVVWLDDIDVH